MTTISVRIVGAANDRPSVLSFVALGDEPEVRVRWNTAAGYTCDTHGRQGPDPLTWCAHADLADGALFWQAVHEATGALERSRATPTPADVARHAQSRPDTPGE